MSEEETKKTPAEWFDHFKTQGRPIDPFMNGGAMYFNHWYPNTQLTEAAYVAGVKGVELGLQLGGHPLERHS